MSKLYKSCQWGAILVGLIGVAGGIYIATFDAFQTGEWDYKHPLVVLVILLAITTGHLAFGAFRRWQPVKFSAFMTLFLVATLLTLILSVGRQHTVADKQDAVVSQAVDMRSRLEAQLADFKDKRDGANATLAQALRDMQDECGSGRGPKCRGHEHTVQNYRDVAGSYDLDINRIVKELNSLPPVPVAEDAATADILATAVSVFFTDEAVVKEKVARIIRVIKPFLFTLGFEFASIFGFTFGLGHGRQAPTTQVTTKPVEKPVKAAPAPAPVDPTPGPAKAETSPSERRATIHNFVAAYIARTGTVPTIPEVQHAHREAFAMDLAKTTAWNWIKKVEANAEPAQRLRVVG